MQSDYHRRFHEQARQYLDPRVFHDIHVKARGSTGGAAPRTPKDPNRQPDDAPTPMPPADARVSLDKQPVHKSALEAIGDMWSRTLDALTGRQNVTKSGIEDDLSAFYAVGPDGHPIKNPHAKKKKKRVTKSALSALSDAVAEHDGVEPDGVVAIQLGAEHGRTKGAIGLGYVAQDKATIAHDLDTGMLPFEDASVDQVYVRKSAVDDGLDIDAMMPELRRVCAPGARIYADFGLTTVNKSGEWDEDAHARSENGEFGSGGKAAANSSASHARNRTAQKLAEHSVERMKALKKRINKSTETDDVLNVIRQAKKHKPDKPKTPLGAKLEQFTSDRKQLVQKSVTAEKPIAGLDTYRQIVYAPVLVPDEISVKGHHITCEDIEYSAHRYLRQGAICGSEHGRPIDAHVVESFIAPQDLHFTGDGTPYGEQHIPKGSWVIGMRIDDPEEWDKVMSGEYTGFSTGGRGILRDWEYS